METREVFEETFAERSLLYIEPGPVVLVSTFDGERNNVMTISWTLALDFAQNIALCTGPWNHSFETILDTRECVVAIPPASFAETAVRIGDVSGTQTDKFEAFGLTALPADTVAAPLIGECIANLECTLEDYVSDYGLLILHVNKVWEKKEAPDRRMFHAFGDGTFAADGEIMNYRDLMADKLPPGL